MQLINYILFMHVKIIFTFSFFFMAFSQQTKLHHNTPKFDQIELSVTNNFFERESKTINYSNYSGSLIFQGVFVLSPREAISLISAISFANYNNEPTTSNTMQNDFAFLNPYFSYIYMDSASATGFEFGLFLSLQKLKSNDPVLMPFTFSTAEYKFYTKPNLYTFVSKFTHLLFADNLVKIVSEHSIYISSLNENELWFVQPYFALKYNLRPNRIQHYDYGMMWFTTIEMKDIMHSPYKSAVSHIEFYFGIDSDRFKPVLSYEIKAYDFNIKHHSQTIKLNFSYQFSPIIDVINFD